jgi:hypothetical protein
METVVADVHMLVLVVEWRGEEGGGGVDSGGGGSERVMSWHV